MQNELQRCLMAVMKASTAATPDGFCLVQQFATHCRSHHARALGLARLALLYCPVDALLYERKRCPCAEIAQRVGNHTVTYLSWQGRTSKLDSVCFSSQKTSIVSCCLQGHHRLQQSADFSPCRVHALEVRGASAFCTGACMKAAGLRSCRQRCVDL